MRCRDIIPIVENQQSGCLMMSVMLPHGGALKCPTMHACKPPKIFSPYRIKQVSSMNKLPRDVLGDAQNMSGLGPRVQGGSQVTCLWDV